MRERTKSTIGVVGAALLVVSCSMSLDFDELRKPSIAPLPDALSDAVVDAVSDDVLSDAIPDVARDATPGKVQCGATLCDELCCVETSPVCATSQSCGLTFSDCDEPEDCPLDKTCCTDLKDEKVVAKCESTCARTGNNREVCRPGTACRSGQCAPYHLDERIWVCPN